MTLSQKIINDADTRKLTDDEIKQYLLELPNWQLRDGKLFRHFNFKNFKESKSFVDKVSELAEQVNHHPDIKFSFKYAEIEIYTHRAGGITESDVVLASKIDLL
jgi:4a-hydroxytetrahydrobiopterin dehydratase